MHSWTRRICTKASRLVLSLALGTACADLAAQAARLGAGAGAPLVVPSSPIYSTLPWKFPTPLPVPARTPSSNDPTITVRPPPDSAVEAPHDGTVVARSTASAAPGWIAISHGTGVYAVISGDLEPVVARDARVARGQNVGRVLAGGANADPEVRVEVVSFEAPEVDAAASTGDPARVLELLRSGARLDVASLCSAAILATRIDGPFLGADRARISVDGTTVGELQPGGPAMSAVVPYGERRLLAGTTSFFGRDLASRRLRVQPGERWLVVLNALHENAPFFADVAREEHYVAMLEALEHAGRADALEQAEKTAARDDESIAQWAAAERRTASASEPQADREGAQRRAARLAAEREAAAKLAAEREAAAKLAAEREAAAKLAAEREAAAKLAAERAALEAERQRLEAARLALEQKAAPAPTAAPPLAPTTRAALVIGNAAYPGAPLRNPVNDARAMARKLAGYGFDVMLRENVRVREIGRVLAEFGARVPRGASVVFFYAGHGIQMKGENFLPAVDADVKTEYDLPTQSFSLNRVLDVFGDRKAALTLVMLDACRNNPFGTTVRATGSGLAPVNAASGTLLSYATRPGSVAVDGTGEHGLYTTHLLRHMDTPDLPIELVFKRVASDVKRASRGAQEPWTEGNIDGDFVFNAKPPAPAR